MRTLLDHPDVSRHGTVAYNNIGNNLHGFMNTVKDWNNPDHCRVALECLNKICAIYSLPPKQEKPIKALIKKLEQHSPP